MILGGIFFLRHMADMDDFSLEDARGLESLRDRWELQEFAAGGFGGAVCEATDPDQGDDATLRVYEHDRLVDDAERRIEELEALSHPGIADVIDVKFGDSHVAIVTERVDGESVLDMADDEDWRGEPDRAAEFGYDAANILAYVHEEGGLHRDVRPESFVRDSRGRVRLRYVGLAGLIDEEPARRESSATVEAPESADPDGDVGPWTDLYGFGASLYGAVTGRSPFDDDAEPASFVGTDRTWPVAAAELNPEVTPFLSSLVMRLLAQEPGRRYRSAEELRWDLETYLDERESGEDDIWWTPRVWSPAAGDDEPFVVPRDDVGSLFDSSGVVGPDDVQVTVVAGGAGMGKTSVLADEADRLEQAGATPIFALGSAHPAGMALVEHLARGALQAIHKDDAVDLDAWRDHVRDASPACRQLVDRLPGLDDLIATAAPASSGDASLENPVMHAVATWRELFEVLIDGPTPFVWVVDELQEADDLSRELLTEFICRRSIPSRWLVSCTPGVHESGDRWIENNIEASDRCIQRLELPEFDRGAVGRALGRIVHVNDENRDQLLDWLMEMSGGRPREFQIAFRQLLDEDAIQFRAGKPRFMPSVMADAEFADAPGAYLRNIWEDLSPDEREVATRLALFGDAVPFALLPEIVSNDEIDPERHIDALTERHLVETFVMGDDRWLGFADEAIRLKIIDGVSGSELERQHRMLGFALVDVFEQWEQVESDRGWVGVHAACQWLAAGDTSRTVEWFARAGRLRLDQGRVPNALGLLREAEKRAEDPTADGPNDRTLAELLADALAAADQADEATDYYERALDSDGFEADTSRRRRLQLKLARVLHRQRKFEGAREVVSEYLETTDLELPDVDARFGLVLVDLVFRFIVMQACFRLGIFEAAGQADEQVDREIEFFEAGRILSSTLVDDHFSMSPRLQHTLGLRAMSLRDPRLLALARATQAYSRAIGESPSAGRARTLRDVSLEFLGDATPPRVSPFVGATAASVSLWVGDRDDAFAHVRRFRDDALGAGRFPEYARLLDVSVYLALYAGNLTAADRILERYRVDANAFGTVEVRHWIRCFRANISLLRGRQQEAREHVDAARSVNVRLQDPAKSAEIDGLDLVLLWREGRRDDALELARSAVGAIEDDLHAHPLAETLCRAARIACLAAAESKRGEYDEPAETLREFAHRCITLADERTEDFSTLRPLVECESARLATERGEMEAALESLDRAARLAGDSGQLRFEALASELRARLRAESSPLRACSDAARARALYDACECYAGVGRVASIEEALRETADEFAPPAPSGAEASTTEPEGPQPPELPTEVGAESTIELSPEETAVEIVSEADSSTIHHRDEPKTARWSLPTPARTGSEDDDQEEPPDLEA